MGKFARFHMLPSWDYLTETWGSLTIYPKANQKKFPCWWKGACLHFSRIPRIRRNCHESYFVLAIIYSQEELSNTFLVGLIFMKIIDSLLKVRNAFYLRAVFARHYAKLAYEKYLDNTPHKNFLIKREMLFLSKVVLNSKIRNYHSKKNLIHPGNLVRNCNF